jgi:hypothetical protein
MLHVMEPEVGGLSRAQTAPTVWAARTAHTPWMQRVPRRLRGLRPLRSSWLLRSLRLLPSLLRRWLLSRTRTRWVRAAAELVQMPLTTVSIRAAFPARVPLHVSQLIPRLRRFQLSRASAP